MTGAVGLWIPAEARMTGDGALDSRERLTAFLQDQNLPVAPYKHRSASERM